MQEISPGVSRFVSAQSSVRHPVNSYFVTTQKGAVLIDPAKDFALESLPQKPDAIFITHTQEEHIAGAANFPNVPLYVPSGDEYLYQGRAAYQSLDTTWQAHGSGKRGAITRVI